MSTCPAYHPFQLDLHFTPENIGWATPALHLKPSPPSLYSSMTYRPVVVVAVALAKGAERTGQIPKKRWDFWG